MSNPLLEPFKGAHATAPFTQIDETHFKPAFQAAIAQAKDEIDAITSTAAAPTFENTIEALEFSGQRLERISSIFFNLNAAETNESIQQLAQEISPWLSEFSNDVRLNEALFKRVKTVYESRADLNLTTEQATLLEKKYKGFSRNGANLEGRAKDQLREIDKKLAQLTLKFGENVLAETNSFSLHITDQKELSGLPESAVEAAALLANQQEKEGWVFSLDYPSYVPFMTYADSRSLREKMAKAFGARGFQQNSNNNEHIVLEIVQLRYERAILLGYASHAEFVLEQRMAENARTVLDFENELLEKAKPAALREFKMLEELAHRDGIEVLQKWDTAYYSEKLKKLRFDFDQEQLKPYFKLETVIDGVFQIAHKLFDLNFKAVSTIDTYHEDVMTYEVYNNSGDFVAVFYADFFPRKGKRNGAWMTSFKGQWKRDAQNSRPHISIVCNFTKPTKTKPSLLTFNEVTTLFHEFGHALHGMLADTVYPSLSGTSVYWDFVELPSQLLENWCYEKQALDLFAKHYETNEPIPEVFVEKIKESANFLEGIQTLRQLSFGLLDMAWHASEHPRSIASVKEFETAAFRQTKLYPEVAENCMSTSFGHIFQGGYAAGYYSYKWAEVLDADAFELFKENGIFNRATAQKLATHVLSQGGTEKPMVLYKRFRGKEPKNDALLKRAGLLTN